MKKLMPYFLAVAVLFASLILIRPAPSKTVVVAARDLRAGQPLTEADVALRSVPVGLLPADALTNIQSALGQTLQWPRGEGDVIRQAHLGKSVALAEDERAVAVEVTDAGGLGGLLAPGMTVGVVAAIPVQGQGGVGTFAKATVEGLRVLYVDPRFAVQQSPQPMPTAGAFGVGLYTQERAQKGYVVLAVPTSLTTILYDFSASGALSESRKVNALELLSALQATTGATVTLYLTPDDAQRFASPGLWLPDLVITPAPTATPSSTPTPTLGGGR